MAIDLSEEIRKKIKELDEELKKALSEAEDSLKALSDLASEDRGVTQEALEALREARSKAKELRRSFLKARIGLRSALRKARLGLGAEGVSEEELEKIEEEINNFLRKWEGVIEDFLKELNSVAAELRREGKTLTISIESIDRIIDEGLRGAFKGVEAAMKKLEEVLGGLEKPSGPTYVVSSIRLPQNDLDLIDLLVEAGIFKSRSEAVAFFTHKGIEAAKPALEEVLDKLRELKELRDEIIEDLKKALEES